jgi:hypothetical protein
VAGIGSGVAWLLIFCVTRLIASTAIVQLAGVKITATDLTGASVAMAMVTV